MRKLLLSVFLSVLALGGCKKTDYHSTDEEQALGNVAETYIAAPVPDVFYIGVYGITSDTTGDPIKAQTLVNTGVYADLQNANVNLITCVGGYSQKLSENLKILDHAQTYGLKVIPSVFFQWGWEGNGTTNYPLDSLYHFTSLATIEEAVNAVAAHPATAGFYIRDEPNYGFMMDTAIKLANHIHNMLGNAAKIKWINLFPSWVGNHPNWGITYNQYIETLIQGRGVQNLEYLSFDRYLYYVDPVTNAAAPPLYFQNLNIIRQKGLEYGINTAAYLQCIGHSNNVSGPDKLAFPTINEMRFNAYSTLAYGVKMLTWFQYSPAYNYSGANVTAFGEGIVTINGVKTSLYNGFKDLNGEIKYLGLTLQHLDATLVYHTIPYDNIPPIFIPNTKLFPSSALGADPNLIITVFTDRTSANKEYVMIVNNTLQTKTYTFNAETTATNVKRVSELNGSEVSTNFSALSHQLSETFLPGQGKLFVIYR